MKSTGLWQSSAGWFQLPPEIQQVILEAAELDDVCSFATTCRDAYAVSVPILYSEVFISSFESMKLFLQNVPVQYGTYVHRLTVRVLNCPAIFTPQLSQGYTALLQRCAGVNTLKMFLNGPLDKSVIPAFAKLSHLRNLCISNFGDPIYSPLSEKLVVSIAATVPNLTKLTVGRIARSCTHIPVLVDRSPFVPVRSLEDNELPPHPYLDTHLSLPSLLRLPNLRSLRLFDSNLDDPLWSTVQCTSRIERLDLGACCYQSPSSNGANVTCILANFIKSGCASSLKELTVNTAINLNQSEDLSLKFPSVQSNSIPFPNLQKLHISPLVQIEDVGNILSTFAMLPVLKQIIVSCHEDDLDDMLDVLQTFFALRFTHSAQGNKIRLCYPSLEIVTLRTTSDDLEEIISTCDIPLAKGGPEKTLVSSLTSQTVGSLVHLKKLWLGNVQKSHRREGWVDASLSVIHSTD
ncbi:hypothetical protein C8Q75DRAFT_806289 [Abortiporus biennis]|nr:hypothetical protein C8Q75DRAFT_806289 [Abortiporus biennis]